MTLRVAVIFDRFGPYHVARLNGARTKNHIFGMEMTAVDSVYKWDTVGDDEIGFERVKVGDGEGLAETLSRLDPDVVAVPGWGEQYSLAALAWCLDAGVPAIVMSESTEHDEPRKWWKEFVKKRIVGNFSAGLVGGRSHVAYMRRLGMPADRIFTGYDVVDNAYFARGADAARADMEEQRKKHMLPEKYFLSSNRFIAKKNLFRLVRAYARYRQTAGADSWKLVLLGDGELRPEIEKLIDELGLGGEVLLPGFMQYPDLPAYYGLAQVYVHASTTEQWGLVVNEAMASGLPVIVSERCGCAPELVVDGENGYTFDPYDDERLTELMLKISGKGVDLDRMGEASREIIARWSPEAFAEGLARACEKAVALPRRENNFWNRTVLRLLAR